MSHETLVDAVDRLLDRIFTDYAEQLSDPAFREAVELTRRAYLRERDARDEYPSDFPVIPLEVPA